MDKENMIELLEDFIDFLKEKDDENKKAEVNDADAEAEDNDADADADEDFDNAIGKIAKGE